MAEHVHRIRSLPTDAAARNADARRAEADHVISGRKTEWEQREDDFFADLARSRKERGMARFEGVQTFHVRRRVVIEAESRRAAARLLKAAQGHLLGDEDPAAGSAGTAVDVEIEQGGADTRDRAAAVVFKAARIFARLYRGRTVEEAAVTFDEAVVFSWSLDTMGGALPAAFGNGPSPERLADVLQEVPR